MLVRGHEYRRQQAGGIGRRARPVRLARPRGAGEGLGAAIRRALAPHQPPWPPRPTGRQLPRLASWGEAGRKDGLPQRGRHRSKQGPHLLGPGNLRETKARVRMALAVALGPIPRRRPNGRTLRAEDGKGP
jgi:hypothetical protein